MYFRGKWALSLAEVVASNPPSYPLGDMNFPQVNDRSHMWLVAGEERGATLLWSQPELVLFERDRSRGHGYPDIITDLDGQVGRRWRLVVCCLLHIEPD